MITNKDVRVENGNLVLNGDKYPLGGQSPEAIMAIVKDNSDTTPTDTSTNPVTSGGVYTSLNSLDTAKADVFKSQSPDVSQSINVGTLAVAANRMFLLSSGYQGAYVFGLVFVSSINNIEYVDISHKDATVSSISYNDGVVSIKFSSATYTPTRLIRLC